MKSEQQIIVVSGDRAQVDDLACPLREAGWPVTDFSGAEAALAAMSPTPPPALIITDIRMAGIDGFRFCRLLRSPEYQAFNCVPIMVVSAAYAGGEPERIAADLGAQSFIPTPVDAPVFVNTVRQLISDKGTRPVARVLIVEDSRMLAAVLEKRFARYGYEADTVATVAAARVALDQHAFDIALIDYMLPDGLGDSLIETIKHRHAACACVMMTGHSDPALAIAWMKRGASAYLKKPFALEYLIEVCLRARREMGLLNAEALLERRTRELHRSEEMYRILFTRMLSGFALHEIICDDNGRPVDYRFINVNPAFERITGLSARSVVGRTVREVLPDTEPVWIETYGRVALTGRPETFENYTEGLKKHFLVSAFCPAPNRFACVFDDVTDRKRMETDLANVATWERQRLKRDLHDGIAQQMTAIGFLAKKLTTDLERSGRPETSVARDIGDTAHTAMDMLHNIVSGVEPITESPAMLEPALQDLVDRITRIYAIDCRVAMGRTVRLPDLTTANHLYYIAQEAVMNAAKHAACKHVLVALTQQAGSLKLSVRDDGEGVRPRDQSLRSGMGITIMRVRANLIGASLDWVPGEKRGTTVTCIVPRRR